MNKIVQNMNKMIQNQRCLRLLTILSAAMFTASLWAQTPITVKEVSVKEADQRKAPDYFAKKLPDVEKKTLYVNHEITTFIVTGDVIKMMDISVPGNVVTGNQPGENIVRIKPVKEAMEGEELGVVTIICERSIIQFDVVYTVQPSFATTQYNCTEADGVSYLNPEVDMSYRQMYQYAWRIMNSGQNFYDVSSTYQKMKLTLNNIYTTGNYFFIDFSLKNRSKIKFDIEEIKVKLCDKKQLKATNYQEIEMTPVMMLNTDKSFKRDYRNVIVLPKFTFPDEKVLTITVSETPISGRTITMKIDYEDILNADSFHTSLMP